MCHTEVLVSLKFLRTQPLDLNQQLTDILMELLLLILLIRRKGICFKNYTIFKDDS